MGRTVGESGEDCRGEWGGLSGKAGRTRTICLVCYVCFLHTSSVNDNQIFLPAQCHIAIPRHFALVYFM